MALNQDWNKPGSDRHHLWMTPKVCSRNTSYFNTLSVCMLNGQTWLVILRISHGVFNNNLLVFLKCNFNTLVQVCKSNDN